MDVVFCTAGQRKEDACVLTCVCERSESPTEYTIRLIACQVELLQRMPMDIRLAASEVWHFLLP